MFFSALLICVVFLTLFGLALWPVLFKQSKHRKLIFTGANITFIIMLLAFGGTVGRNRQEMETRREQMRDALILAADLMERGKMVKLSSPDTSAKHPGMILDEISRFVRELRKEAAQ